MFLSGGGTAANNAKFRTIQDWTSLVLLKPSCTAGASLFLESTTTARWDGIVLKEENEGKGALIAFFSRILSILALIFTEGPARRRKKTFQLSTKQFLIPRSGEPVLCIVESISSNYYCPLELRITDTFNDPLQVINHANGGATIMIMNISFLKHNSPFLPLHRYKYVLFTAYLA